MPERNQRLPRENEKAASWQMLVGFPTWIFLPLRCSQQNRLLLPRAESRVQSCTRCAYKAENSRWTLWGINTSGLSVRQYRNYEQGHEEQDARGILHGLMALFGEVCLQVRTLELRINLPSEGDQQQYYFAALVEVYINQQDAVFGEGLP